MGYEKIVYVLVGQRGAGKSTYANKLVAQMPELKLISRDDILMQLFGSIECDPYCGNLEHGDAETWREVEKILSVDCQLKLVFDYWNWTSDDRKRLIQRLRQLGATSVIALYFTTPLETVNEWFWLKPNVAKASQLREIGTDKGFTFYLDSVPTEEYENFHRLASHIDSDGFDQVIRMDPTPMFAF